MREERVEMKDLSLGVLTAGDPAQPALVLLHGWPQCKQVYDQVIDALGEDYYVLAFDLPAIGASRGAPPSAEKTVLADIALRAAEQAGARSILVAGFDVGGMIAFAAARDHAERIVGAVVMNTVLPGIDPWAKVLADPRIWHFAFHAIPDLPETLVSGHERRYFDFFVDVLAGRREALTDTYRSAFAKAYERPEALKAGFDWYRAMPADAQHNSRARQIRTPLLYLRGDADGRTPDDYVAGLKKAGALNVASGVLPDSGELAPLEVPQAFMQVLLAFAERCRGA
jgi:pimeloyl-ACP methyl ester carboxylesterase